VFIFQALLEQLGTVCVISEACRSGGHAAGEREGVELHREEGAELRLNAFFGIMQSLQTQTR